MYPPYTTSAGSGRMLPYPLLASNFGIGLIIAVQVTNYAFSTANEQTLESGVVLLATTSCMAAVTIYTFITTSTAQISSKTPMCLQKQPSDNQHTTARTLLYKMQREGNQIRALR